MKPSFDEMSNEDKVAYAAREYVARQNRELHPEGEFDTAGRWYPSVSELCGYCPYIRSPSRSWPYSLQKHCRTADHIALKYGLDATEVRRAARKLKLVGK